MGAGADVVRLYGASWGEPDETERRKLLDKAWTDDGVYSDPTALVQGREALIEHIAEFQAQFPGHMIVLMSGVDEHDGFLRFGWEMRNPDGATVVDGVDFGELAPDGRLARITGFFGPLPPPPAA